MTDPNPLLLSQHPTKSEPPTPAAYRSLDETIEHCIGGHFGWTQLLQSAIASFAWFFDAQQTFITVFTDAEPTWSCRTPSPPGHFTKHLPCTSDVCQLPSDSWSWDSPPHSSIISDWSLECSGPVIAGLPASSFFLGCLAGGFLLATLADTCLGRKNLLVLSCLLMSLSGVLTAAVSTNVWVYSGLRFLSGFGRSTIGTCALVLATELVGKKWRGNVGILGFIWFTFGFLSLSIIAFLLKGSSWRLIYLWTCVPCVFYSLLVYFTVHESPRWLFINGRKQEFAETLRNMMATQRISTEICLSDFVQQVAVVVEPQEHGLYSALKILLKKRWALHRLALAVAVAFGLGTVIIGMPLSLGNLSFDLYLSVALNALSELPASLVAFFLIGRMNRRGLILGLASLSGVCSVACAVVGWKGVKISLELVSFSAASTAVDVLLIYVLELFPTCVRNSAVAVVRQAIVLSGVLSPVVVAAGRGNGRVSYGVFGAVILVCGLFVVFLPETRGRALCDTMEEEELNIVKQPGEEQLI